VLGIARRLFVEYLNFDGLASSVPIFTTWRIRYLRI
jgi:hypothetical protein